VTGYPSLWGGGGGGVAERTQGGGLEEKGIVEWDQNDAVLVPFLFLFFFKLSKGHFRNSDIQNDVVLGFPSILIV
jgi:hypothetical protein